MFIPQAQTIADAISMLEVVIASARRENSRLGYFPALYRKVTIRVRDGLLRGEFEDNSRMENLDVNFANRYLAAVYQHWNGETPTRAWQLSFEADQDRRPIVLQHLLLGINAHINLDLGIAAAQTCPGAELPGLKNDFFAINTLLASLVSQVKAEINQVSPLFGPLDQWAGITDDVMINFSLQKARDAAWRAAEKLATLSPEQQTAEIIRMDQWVANFGKIVWKPPSRTVRFFLALIRLGERKSAAEIINVLT